MAHQSAPLDYQKYLRRKLWKTIKERVLDRDSWKCFRRGGGAAVVHHRSYAPEVMQGLADEYLVSLCDGCHAVVHKDDAGRWRLWAEAEAALSTSGHRTDFPEPLVDLRRMHTPYPVEWARMTRIQRQAWGNRVEELTAEKRKKRKSGPTTAYFSSREAAEAEAFKILDQNPRLAGRFRESWEHLLLALLSQGHELYGNATVLRSGLRAKIAKTRFERFADHAIPAHGYTPISEQERADLESEAIWNRPRPSRQRNRTPQAPPHD
jgi:hypothetical protein